MDSVKTPDFTIVIPVYFNQGSLLPTMEDLRLQVLTRDDGLKGEVVFVEDGSKDRSLAELLEIQSRFPGIVRIIKFTRNFGQVSAIRAGLTHAKGRCAIVISADGQDPPELMNEMLKGYFAEGKEVVLCAREDREESRFRKVTSGLFYHLMRRISFPTMPAGGFDYFLLGRRALDEMIHNEETHPFLQGQILWLGYDVKVLGYTRRERKVGRSRWTFGKKLTYLLDGVLSYSFTPIRLVSLFGVISAVLGFAYALVVLVNWGIHGNPVQGWTPLMIVILILGGMQLLSLGLIGEYLWRTLAQARNRKPYIIDRVYE